MTQPTHIALPIDLAAELLTFLNNQPHGLVRKHIDAITTAPQITITVPEKPAEAAPPVEAVP